MMSIQICTVTDILREKTFCKVEMNTLQKVNRIHFCTETNIMTQNTFCRVEMNLLQESNEPRGLHRNIYFLQSRNESSTESNDHRDLHQNKYFLSAY